MARRLGAAVAVAWLSVPAGSLKILEDSENTERRFHSPTSRKTRARLAGFMFLFGIAAYMAGHHIASGFFVAGNFAATAHEMIASREIYRVGLAC
jgi:hypothetical protein